MSMPVDQVASQIHDLVNNDGVLGTGRNDNLHQINKLLTGLPPNEVDQVLSKLSSGDLQKWAADVNKFGALGTQGLSQNEKKDLFNMFSKDLDGKQLARVSNAFGDRGDVQSLSQSVAQHASTEAKVQYVQQLAGQTTGGKPSVSWLTATTTFGNQDASAVGNVLASLKGNPQAITQALNSLSGPQLQAVMKAAENYKTTSLPQGGIINQTDARPLQAILSAAATSNDPEVKARVFEAGTKALADVQDSNHMSAPNLGAAADAKRIEQGLTDILNSDTTGVVRALKQDERSGKSLTNYMKEMFTEDPSGSNKAIGNMIARLQQGNSLSQNPLDFVDKSVDDGHGQQAYINAENLGYFSGAMQAGINKITSDVKTQGDILNNVFTTAVSVGTGWKIPDPVGVPVKIGATVANAGIREAIREVTAAVTEGNKTLEDALFELSVPHTANGKAAELGADPAFDSIRSTVIHQNQ